MRFEDDLLPKYARRTRNNLRTQAAVPSFGVESENVLEFEDGQVPRNRAYQDLLNEIEENLDGPELRDEFGFDPNPVENKSSSSMMPQELPKELKLKEGSLIDFAHRTNGVQPIFDYDFGPQLEISPGASAHVMDPAIEGLQVMQDVAEISTPEHMRFSDWAYLKPLRNVETNDPFGWHLKDTDRTTDELLRKVSGIPTLVGYYPDYPRAMGPGVLTNGYAGSTQTTGPIKKTHETWDKTLKAYLVGLGDEPGQFALERGKDPLTSNARIGDNFTDVGAPLWEIAYSESPIIDSDEAEDRGGFPPELVSALESSPEDAVIDTYLNHMADYTKVFFDKPGREYVHFDGDGLDAADAEFHEIPLLAANLDEPVTQREFMNSEEASFSKYVMNEDGSRNILTGKIDISEMPYSEKVEYLWGDLNTLIATTHHDIRLKPALGATEQRTDRNANEYEPQVITLQGSIKHVGQGLNELAAEEYGISNDDIPEDADMWRDFWADASDMLEETAEGITVNNSPYPKSLTDFIHDVQENGNPAQQRYRGQI